LIAFRVCFKRPRFGAVFFWPKRLRGRDALYRVESGLHAFVRMHIAGLARTAENNLDIFF